MLRKKIFLLFVGGLLAAVVAITYVSIFRPRQDLRRFLTAVEATQVGKTTLSEWRDNAEHARSPNVTVKDEGETSAVSWRGDNNLLKTLRLAPRTVVHATIGFKNGIVSSIYLVMDVMEHGEEDWHNDRAVVVRLSDDSPSACHEDYAVEVKQRSGTSDRNWATVAMDRCVSRENFAKAIAINGDCLTRIGGCKTIEAMLPQVLGHP